jgi:hypothetical protein
MQRSDLLNWCNGQGDSLCAIDVKDFRRGDASMGLYGDFTHPAHTGQTKAATQIKNFLLNSPLTQAWIQQ